MIAILTTLALVQSGITDTSSETHQIAETYMQAYQEQDLDLLQTLYADDAVFLDPTSGDVLPITPPIHWEGPDAIIAGLRSWGTARMTYTLDRSFNASGRFVYEGVSNVVYATPEGERVYQFPIITIVTIEDGEVTEHRDYTDYDGMREVTAAP
ncbi:nuclear transport factor 2 family protein [Maricaulis parjimensis]|uniref:nuclear transport factor 2 family protein n=1 Tax=Maricaulis parjimensis TaxID=144023 RepID=UPI001939487C|nr:nuclear transport factor 2 family protein [Maricaulis parjimensis]